VTLGSFVGGAIWPPHTLPARLHTVKGERTALHAASQASVCVCVCVCREREREREGESERERARARARAHERERTWGLAP
jgi:hypothetical protein